MSYCDIHVHHIYIYIYILCNDHSLTYPLTGIAVASDEKLLGLLMDGLILCLDTLEMILRPAGRTDIRLENENEK